MMKKKPIASSLIFVAVTPFLAGTFTGCASRMARQEQEERQEAAATAARRPVQPSVQSTNLQSPPPSINSRLDDLEAKIAAMNDKLNATREALDSFLAAHQPKGAGVPMQAADTVGMAVTASPPQGSAQAGFVDDDSVHQYRKAAVLLQTQRYAEAIGAFSAFLGNYPDSPLAGSAQFHVGEAYFRQGQYLKADAEFQKVLTSYDRSPHVSDTLRLMAQAEDKIGKTEAAARHRQLLTSLFAASPAAARASQTAQPPAAPRQQPAQSQVKSEDDSGIPANPVTPLAKPGLDEPPPTASQNE